MTLSSTSRRNAWGMKLPLFNPDDKYKGSPTDNFKYNGKEYMVDLGYYEYGFRIYDPTTARFTAVDPMSEKREWLSSYNYVQNNPILRIDPNGAVDREAGEMMSEVERSKEFHKMNGSNVYSDCPTCPKNSSFDVYRNNDNLFTYAGQNDKGEDIVLNGNGDGPSVSSGRTRSQIWREGFDVKVHDAVGIEGNLSLNGLFTSIGVSGGIWKSRDEWSYYFALTPGGQVSNTLMPSVYLGVGVQTADRRNTNKDFNIKTVTDGSSEMTQGGYVLSYGRGNTLNDAEKISSDSYKIQSFGLGTGFSQSYSKTIYHKIFKRGK